MGEHKTNPIAAAANSRTKCGTCAHWVRDNGEVGHCRRSPPMPMLQPKQGLRGMEMALGSHWPPIGADRWCGEHTQFLRWFSENRDRIAEIDALDRAEAATA